MAFPAICLSPSLEVGRAFSFPGSMFKWISKNLYKTTTNEGAATLSILFRCKIQVRKRLHQPINEKDEGKDVQREKAGFTVTKQQSNKSAFALRNFPPRNAIFPLVSDHEQAKRKENGCLTEVKGSDSVEGELWSSGCEDVRRSAAAALGAGFSTIDSGSFVHLSSAPPSSTLIQSPFSFWIHFHMIAARFRTSF